MASAAASHSSRESSALNGNETIAKSKRNPIVGFSGNTEPPSADHSAGAGASGFTPIELLIATTLLGIVAAAFVPRMLSTNEASLQRDLLHKVHLVRGQIEQFRQAHSQRLPGEGRSSGKEFLRDLSSVPLSAGHSSSTQQKSDISGSEFPPLNPYSQRSEILVIPDRLKPHHYSGDGRHGWAYSSTTGEFRANLSPTITDRSGRKIHQL
jgi:type II secretory pathway pseudopilin PulG